MARMSIAAAASIYRLALSGASLVPYQALTTPILLEGCSYNFLRTQREDTHHFTHIHSLRLQLLKNISNIQRVFNVMNVGYALVYFSQLNLAIQKKYNFSLIPLNGNFSNVRFILVLGSVFSLAFYASFKYEREAKKDDEISEDPPYEQILGRSLLITQTALATTLSYFSEARFWLTINIVSSLYTLWSQSAITWLKISKDFQYENVIIFSKLTMHYSTFILSKKTNECSICLDRNVATRVSFCTNHFFDKECLSNHLKTEISKIGSEIVYQRNENGIYSVKIPLANCPACPLCRERPPQNILDVIVHPDIGLKQIANVMFTS